MSESMEATYTMLDGRIIRISERPAAGIGHKLWDCSIALSRYLETNVRKLPIKNKRWIELGAGCGLLGQVLALLGASEVILTDLPEVLVHLRAQVRRNVGDAKTAIVRELTWGKTDVSTWGTFDGVVCADVIYQMDQVPLLVQTLRALCELGSRPPTILITGEVRCPYTHEAFVKQASEYFTISPVSLKKYLAAEKELAGTEFFLLSLRFKRKAQ